MIFWLYNLLIVLLSPVWVIWMVWRAKRRNEQPDWKQRCGELPIEAPAKGERRVWVHAVSVGEVMAALPVLKEIRALDPELKIVLSTTTSSGQQAAKERALNLFDHLVYFPIDVPRFVVASLMRVRPKVVAVMETELWLNFLTVAKNFGARTIVVNGRMSERSFSRSLKFKPYYKALFQNLDQAFVQSESDAERFKAVGFPSPVVSGNTKYDAAVDELEPGKDWRKELGVPADAFLVVVGSTRSEAEETLVLDALPEVPTAWVVHAPRHIERAAALAGAYESRFGSVALRSKGETGQWTILDTYGELGGVYSAADVVVVGGGFDDLGGQNIIQPMAHGKPVIHGPHMQNFRDVAKEAVLARATLEASTSGELAKQINNLRLDASLRDRVGSSARALVQMNLGAAKRCAQAIAEAAKD